MSEHQEHPEHHDDPAHTPQGDHTPRQEEAAARERQQQASADKPTPTPQAASPEEEQAARDAGYRGSRGAQVIYHPDSDASLGARGGAATTMEENVLVRDKHLVANSMDPRDPDATHLPGNVVPPGGEVMDQVSDEHEPVFQPPEPEAPPPAREA